MSRYLVVAHQTAESDALVAHLRGIVESDSGAEFVLLVPEAPVPHALTWSEEEAAAAARLRADQAQTRLRAEGLSVVEARIGDASPIVAAVDAVRTGEWTGIVVSTLPPGVSRWLRLDVVSRVRARTHLPVTHVVGEPAPAYSGAR